MKYMRSLLPQTLSIPMNCAKLAGIALLGFSVSLGMGWANPVVAQGNFLDLGQAVGGQRVRLDLNSIRRVSGHSVDFLYYLGNDARYSQANCNNGSWTTFEDGEVRYPQSDTTAHMIQIVCEEGLGTTRLYQESRWVVFDPPSNVRVTPNGRIQCTVREQQVINVLGTQGEWYLTDVCGSRGYIHNSQVEEIE